MVTIDPREAPYALQQQIIPAVDFREALTPQAIDYVLSQTNPDLVLFARSFGLQARRAASPGALGEALERAHGSAGPTLIEYGFSETPPL